MPFSHFAICIAVKQSPAWKHQAICYINENPKHVVKAGVEPANRIYEPTIEGI